MNALIHCADAQVGLRFYCSHTSKSGFLDVAQMMFISFFPYFLLCKYRTWFLTYEHICLNKTALTKRADRDQLKHILTRSNYVYNSNKYSVIS